MKDQKLQRLPFFPVLFLSWFYSGYSPKAPGTFGSLATLPFIFFLAYLKIGIYQISGLIFILYTLAVFFTHKIQKEFKLHDPQWIVIDEVIGMLITWCFTMSLNPIHILLTFVSFRFFDIIKIWPASYFDQLHHGIGTITDDVISALYAGCLVKLLVSIWAL